MSDISDDLLGDYDVDELGAPKDYRLFGDAGKLSNEDIEWLRSRLAAKDAEIEALKRALAQIGNDETRWWKCQEIARAALEGNRE